MNLNLISLDKIVKQFKTEQPEVVRDIEVQLYNPEKNKPKRNPEDPIFSEDVCTIDEKGLNGLAFFAFDENRWIFYVDNISDYNIEGAGIKWKWYYPPISSKDIEWQISQ